MIYHILTEHENENKTVEPIVQRCNVRRRGSYAVFKLGRLVGAWNIFFPFMSRESKVFKQSKSSFDLFMHDVLICHTRTVQDTGICTSK